MVSIAAALAKRIRIQYPKLVSFIRCSFIAVMAQDLQEVDLHLAYIACHDGKFAGTHSQGPGCSSGVDVCA